MPKALFFNVPAHGHINPSLPLVTELVRRGHDITYFASEGYRARIEVTGAQFQAYADIHDDYFDKDGLHAGVPQRVALALMTTTEQILPALLQSARAAKPDYVLYDGMCPWGYFLASTLRLPAVVSLSLMALSSPPPSAMLNWDMLSAILPMITQDFSKGLAANKLSRALGEKYKVTPLGTTRFLNVPGDLAISYTSRAFQPYADTVSPTVRFIGRTIDETPVQTPFSFEHVQGRKLVYVSLGTLNNDDAAFFRACIEAFTGSDMYVMMSTGNRIAPESFGPLPENIAIYGWVPQFEVLKRASLFVTHAGLNSAHDGLYYGVPLLMVPQQGDQFFTAQRVVELGAGLRLKKSQVSAQTLRENAARLLTEARFKAEAQRIGETLRTAGGVSKAVDEIEALLRGHSSSVSPSMMP